MIKIHSIFKIALIFTSIMQLSCTSDLPFNKEFLLPKIEIKYPLASIDCASCDSCFVCDFTVTGISSGLYGNGNFKIYVLVQKRDSFVVQYPAATLKPDGTWEANASIGDSQNPAFHGQKFNIIAIADSSDKIEKIITPIKSLDDFKDYPKSQLVGLVVERASNLKITSPMGVVQNLTAPGVPDSSSEIHFNVKGTADGIARNTNFKVYILVRSLNDPDSTWKIQDQSGNPSSGAWTASASLQYANGDPVLDGDSLSLKAVATNRSDLIAEIGDGQIMDKELKSKLPDSLFIHSNEVFLKVKRSASLSINHELYFTALEPDTAERSSIEVRGKAEGLILNSHFEIYAKLGDNERKADLDRATGEWKAIVTTENEAFDGADIEISATSKLKNQSKVYLACQPLHSKLQRKLVGRIKGINESPYRIAIVPYREAYITRKGYGEIVTINILENKKGPSIADVGNDLRGIAISLDGLSAYVCDYTDEFIKIIRTRDRASDPFYVGKNCKDIALSYDNRYWLIIKQDSVCRVNSSENNKNGINSPASPSDVAFVPFTYKAYVPMANGDILVFADVSKGLEYQIIQTLQGEINSIAITPDGKKACISIKEGKIAILDVLTDTIVESEILSVGGQPEGIAIFPDSRIALIANTVSHYPNNNKISAIDLSIAPPAIIDTIKVDSHDAHPIDIAITPDGKYAYVVNQDAESVTVIRMDLIK